MVERELTLFNILNDINFDKSFDLHKNSNFDKSFDSFMINRFFSMDCETILEANFVNRQGIPKHAHYLFLSNMIEKKKRFLKYIKKEKADKKKVEIVKNIQDLYVLNRVEAEKVYDIIPDEEKEMIKEIYKVKKKATRKR